MTPDEITPVSRGRLIIKAAIRFPMALIMLGAAFFIPAGGLHYWKELMGTVLINRMRVIKKATGRASPGPPFFHPNPEPRATSHELFFS